MPVRSTEVTQDYARYVTAYPGEVRRLAGLSNRLAYGTEPADLSSPEHVTSSAALIAPDGTVLLTPTGGTWMFPGGHADPDDSSLLATARRHLCEVTRLPPRALLTPADHDVIALDYNDEERAYPDGEKHLHYAFTFPVRLRPETADASLHALGSQVDDFRWVSADYFTTSPRLHEKLLSMTAARC